jgi:hypothetical protein
MLGKRGQSQQETSHKGCCQAAALRAHRTASSAATSVDSMAIHTPIAGASCPRAPVRHLALQRAQPVQQIQNHRNTSQIHTQVAA